MSKIDLGFGNPEFMHPYWEYTDKEAGNYNPSSVYNSLIRMIKLYHDEVHNAFIKDRYVVIGTGASQILQGLTHILNRPIIAEAPYYMRYPSLCRLNKLEWADDLRIYTIPNNPDNSIPKEIHSTSDAIFDFSYNWPQYHPVVKMDVDIAVYSLSKATGHSSLRIGWALLKSKELAEELKDYIEHSTMGVSHASMNEAIGVLSASYNNRFFIKSKEILDRRWDLININKSKLSFEILNSSGMFAWCKGKCPDHIECITGEHFGSTSEYFRLNIGCSESKFQEAFTNGLFK